MIYTSCHVIQVLFFPSKDFMLGQEYCRSIDQYTKCLPVKAICQEKKEKKRYICRNKIFCYTMRETFVLVFKFLLMIIVGG